MAVYKVIQDIEAEDKIVGPLTLKGFVYAGIAVTLAFIDFRLAMATGLGPLRWLFVLAFALPMLLFGVLASPLGRDQPTEVWLLSHIRFFLKPRRRVWNQSGILELVTITAPKRPERILTKGFSQSEVNSRLQTLAQTLDSRGWAVKNVNVNLSTSPTYLQNAETPSDRLIDASSLPQDQPVIEVHAADDILDEQNNPTAQHFAALMQKAETTRKQGIFERLKSAVEGKEHEDRKSKPLKIVDQPIPRPHRRKKSSAEEAEEEARLEKRLSKARASFATDHPNPSVKTAAQAARELSDQDQAAQVTQTNQAVNMNLAQSGSDFKVSTLASLANRPPVTKKLGPNEVEIDFH